MSPLIVFNTLFTAAKKTEQLNEKTKAASLEIKDKLFNQFALRMEVSLDVSTLQNFVPHNNVYRHIYTLFIYIQQLVSCRKAILKDNVSTTIGE
jgi:hypothetical protein